MEKVTVSSKGQIAIPKQVRDALNLTEGSKLTLEVRGHEIVLSKGDAWRKLRGAAADGPDLMEKFAAFRKEEREREDSGS
jgi:AbrB family looped-hinge helix DNA binding protein